MFPSIGERCLLFHRIAKLICVLAAIFVAASTVSTGHVTALQLIMMSSSSRQDAFKKSIVQAASSFLPPPPPGADTISSNLISQLAVYAIKRRLKEERTVSCDVNLVHRICYGMDGSVPSQYRGRIGAVIEDYLVGPLRLP